MNISGIIDALKFCLLVAIATMICIHAAKNAIKYYSTKQDKRATVCVKHSKMIVHWHIVPVPNFGDNLRIKYSQE